MNTLETAANGIKQLFKTWGIKLSTDPRYLELPGAIAMPNRIECNRLNNGILTIEWEVYLTAPDSDNPFTSLGEMLDKITQHYSIDSVDIKSLTLPNHSADPLPALFFTLTLEHQND